MYYEPNSVENNGHINTGVARQVHLYIIEKWKFDQLKYRE